LRREIAVNEISANETQRGSDSSAFTGDRAREKGTSLAWQRFGEAVITTPTVLVLGAGASCPYGFPTAKGLKELIRDAFASPKTRATLLLSNESDDLKYTPPVAAELVQFREAFLKSGQPSVDAFLERRPNFLRVGKLAIAYCLIPFEDGAKLYAPDLSRGGDWYEYLSVKLNSSFEQFGDNKLSIITFNYDRSVEHYLLNSLINLHGKNFDECAKALAQIPIVHVRTSRLKTTELNKHLARS
jgi:hypothetical protein